MRKKVAGLLVFTALTTALSGCNGAGDKTGEENSSQITVGIAQDLEDSLDPHKAEAAATREVLFNVFEGLYKPNCDGELIPAVAERCECSEDGLSYTFTLRENVKFHNGNTVTAEDVISSIETCAGTNGGEPLIPAFSNITSIEKTDEKTIVITLAERDADFLSYIASVKAAITPAGQTDADTNPIGTGPYQYVSRSAQENIVMEKFDDYWGEAAYIENVTFQVCADSDSLVMNLNGGAVDMMAHLPVSQAQQLNDNFTVLEGTMNLVQGVYLNHEFEPFQDQRVRQALCYAVNKDEILDIVSDGKGEQVGSSMFPNFRKYYLPELNDTYSYDPEKAKELLSEAGYENSLSFTITVPSNYPQHVATAQVVAEQLKAVGVTVDIEQVEWNTWLSDVYSNRQYEATVVGVDASNLTASAMLSRFCSDAGNNFTNYENADYDATYEKAQLETDDSEQTILYQACETILAEDAANVYIQDLAEMVALSNEFTGYEFYPLYVQDISKIKPVEEQ
ncbi:MAG: ABC transporter substrate-binding protein [Ruminococcus sp.]